MPKPKLLATATIPNNGGELRLSQHENDFFWFPRRVWERAKTQVHKSLKQDINITNNEAKKHKNTLNWIGAKFQPR